MAFRFSEEGVRGVQARRICGEVLDPFETAHNEDQGYRIK
jgi:hypothetical protein